MFSRKFARTGAQAATLAVVIACGAAWARGGDDLAALLRETKAATMQGRWQQAARQLEDRIHAAQKGKRAGDEALLRAELGRVVLEQSFYFRQDQPAAEALIRQSLELAERQRHGRAEALATLQMARLTYTQARGTNANWDQAVQFAERSMKGWESLQEPAQVANALYILGLVRQMRDGREHGLEQFEQMLQLATVAADQEAMANAERHIGYVYEAKKDYPRALRHYERSLQLREDGGVLVNVPFALITLADLHWKAGREKQRAIQMLERAVREAQGSNSVRAEYTARLSLARYLKESGKKDEALRHARLALEGTRAYAATTAGRAAQELIDELVAETIKR